jgi:hypothetical protein
MCCLSICDNIVTHVTSTCNYHTYPCDVDVIDINPPDPIFEIKVGRDSRDPTNRTVLEKKAEYMYTRRLHIETSFRQRPKWAWKMSGLPLKNDKTNPTFFVTT